MKPVTRQCERLVSSLIISEELLGKSGCKGADGGAERVLRLGDERRGAETGGQLCQGVPLCVGKAPGVPHRRSLFTLKLVFA